MYQAGMNMPHYFGFNKTAGGTGVITCDRKTGFCDRSQTIFCAAMEYNGYTYVLDPFNTYTLDEAKAVAPTIKTLAGQTGGQLIDYQSKTELLLLEVLAMHFGSSWLGKPVFSVPLCLDGNASLSSLVITSSS
jgi:hypothetical protein